MTHDHERHNEAHERIWNDSAEGAIITPADPIRHHPLAISILVAFGVDSYRSWLRHRRSSR